MIDEVWPYGYRIHRRTLGLQAQFNDGSVTGEIIAAVLPAAVLSAPARRAHRSADRPKKTAGPCAQSGFDPVGKRSDGQVAPTLISTASGVSNLVSACASSRTNGAARFKVIRRTSPASLNSASSHYFCRKIR